MSDLSLTFAETGPIPDPQCALKDALLLAMQTGVTDANTIVNNATVFLGFLNGTAMTPAATPAPPAGDAATTDDGSTAEAETVNGFPVES